MQIQPLQRMQVSTHIYTQKREGPVMRLYIQWSHELLIHSYVTCNINSISITSALVSKFESLSLSLSLSFAVLTRDMNLVVECVSCVNWPLLYFIVFSLFLLCTLLLLLFTHTHTSTYTCLRFVWCLGLFLRVRGREGKWVSVCMWMWCVWCNNNIRPVKVNIE